MAAFGNLAQNGDDDLDGDGDGLSNAKPWCLGDAGAAQRDRTFPLITVHTRPSERWGIGELLISGGMAPKKLPSGPTWYTRRMATKRGSTRMAFLRILKAPSRSPRI
jgi:hypothetical protein